MKMGIKGEGMKSIWCAEEQTIALSSLFTDSNNKQRKEQ